MKASDNFKIDQAWWNKEKPLTLKSTGLGATMKKYQDAKVKITTLASKGVYSGEFDAATTPFDIATLILDKDIPAAVTKAKGMCGKLLHKDTIAVLDKFKTAISAEKGLLQTLEDNFNKTYKAKHFDPAQLKSSTIEKNLIAEKETAQALYKETELAFKKISNQVIYLKSLEKQGKLREEDVLTAAKETKDDSTKVKKNCATLAKMVQTAEGDISAVDKLFKGGKGVLSFRDQDTIKTHLNSVMKYKNLILDYSSRANMFQSGVESSFNEFKSALTGAKTATSTHLKELALLQKTMLGNEGVTRKLENQFTNLILLPSKMINAVKTAKDRASIVVPPGVDVPVDKWETRMEEWIAAAEQAIKKTSKLLAQSKEIKDKILGRIDPSIKDSDQAKPIIADIEMKYGGIETYNKNCYSDLKTFQDKLKTLKSELSKKA